MTRIKFDPAAFAIVRDPVAVVDGERNRTLREAVELVVAALVPKDFRIFPDRSRDGTSIARVTARDQTRAVHSLRILEMVNVGALDALSVTTRTRPLRPVEPADLDAYCITHAGLARFCDDAAISVRIAEKIEPQPASAVEAPPAAAATSVRHLAPRRRNDLTPIIERAQRECGRPLDTAAVWVALLALAERREPPLIGIAQGDVKYLTGDGVKVLSRGALDARLRRQKARR